MAVPTVCQSGTNLLVNDMELPQFAGSTVLCELTSAIFRKDLVTLKALSTERGSSHVASRVYDNQKRVWRMECALVTASRLGYLEAVKVLVDAGALVDMTDQIIGKSPLHWACNRSHNDVARYLLEHGADVDKTDYYMEPPLVEAVGHKNVPLVHLLLEYGAKLNTIVNYDRDSIVLLALSLHTTEIANLLIQCGGTLATVNREGQDCMTVVMIDPALNLRDQCLYFAQLLVAAGFKLKVKHVDIARLHSKEMGDLITSHYSSSSQLTWLTRQAIRDHLISISGHSSIKRKVQALPLPDWLRDFVLLIHM